MRGSLTLSLLIVLLALAGSVASSRAVVLFTYDFPGSPGGGGTDPPNAMAANQTNGQPWLGTFSDFTRTADLTQMPGAPANNAMGTDNWNQTGTIDTTSYEGFSITAAAGCHLNLTSLNFDATLKPSGPTSFEVDLFLNGSSTAYATMDISPTAGGATYTFNFTPLTDAMNVTSATFSFYGWNAVATGGGIVLDNVITNGSIVPEPGNLYFAILPILLALGSLGRQFSRTGKANARSRPTARISPV